MVKKCVEYKRKAENVLDYRKNADVKKLYEKISMEIESFDGMYTVLDNIINNVKKNPERFLEIDKDELNNRERNLKAKYEIVANCKDQVRQTYNNAIEREVQNQRTINRNYLLNNYPSIGGHNIESDCFYVGNSDKNENLEYINQNTKKLHNAALIISQELSEQNNLIKGMTSEVENGSKLFISMSKLLIKTKFFSFFLLDIKLNFVFEKMTKTMGISSKFTNYGINIMFTQIQHGRN